MIIAEWMENQEEENGDAKKEFGDKKGGGARGGGEMRLKSKVSKKMYSDYCWVCGAETEIPFQPDGKRPVFCKNCYQGVQAGEIIPPTKPKKLETLIIKKASTGKDGNEQKKIRPDKKSAANLDELKKSLQDSLRKLQEKPKEQ